AFRFPSSSRAWAEALSDRRRRSTGTSSSSPLLAWRAWILPWLNQATNGVARNRHVAHFFDRDAQVRDTPRETRHGRARSPLAGSRRAVCKYHGGVMNDALTFLVHHGHAVLFGVAVVNQLGLPFPAAPWLLAAGALAHMGRLEVFASLALAVAASLLAHIAWYEAGRRSGIKIPRLVCRVSIEPEACGRKTETLFARRGPRALVVAHFVPGLVTVAQPLAGTLGMPRAQFIAYNLAGALIWAGGFIILGYVFSHQLEAVGAVGPLLRGGLPRGLVAGVPRWVGWEVFLRYPIMSVRRVARSHAAEH